MAYTQDELPNGLDAKATPIDADVVVVGDSADSNRVKKTTWTQVKAFLKTYFDTLYAGVLGADDNYVTDAEKVIIGNTSGTNTGDEDTASITALGALMDSEVDADIKTLSLPASTTISAYGATVIDDANAAAARATLDVDQAGTDNSTDVTKAGTGTYVSLAGQQITVDPITESDISDLSHTPEGTAVKSTGEVGGTKFLREDGDGTCSWQAPAGGGDVSKVGTPADKQIGVWTGDGTIEGDTNLQFDTSDDTLYIGTGAGTHVLGSALGVMESHKDGSANLFVVSAHGAVASPGVNAVHSRGTNASPTATQTGDDLYFMGGRGYGATAYGSSSKAAIRFMASQNHTDAAMGNYIVFETTPDGSVTRAERLRISDAGISLDGGSTYLSPTELGLLNGLTVLSGSNTGDEVAASPTTSGVSELATVAELETGTDTGRTITPDVLAGSNFGERVVSVLMVEPGTDVAVATDVAMYSIPSSYAGMNLVEVHAEVKTAGVTGVSTIDINKNGTSMLSTKLTIDSGGTGSDTAATAAVIDGAQDDVTSFDVITIDVDGISTTAPKGLVVTMIYRLP